MKKRLILGFFILFLIVILSAGCTPGLKSDKTTDSGNKDTDFRRRPDFGQPEERADITGIVKSIIGNEVTILKMERPGRDQTQAREDGEEGENNERPTMPSLGTTGGRMPMGHGGMAGRRPGSMDEDSRAAMLERMKEMSTGEEVVVIPVGIRMLKPDADSDKMPLEMTEASLADIKQDKMINIWLNKDIADRNIAEFVLILR